MTPTSAPARGGDVGELAGSLRLSVTRLARILRQQSDTGLTPTQLAALATLDRLGPVPIGVLADEEQVGAPTATKVVDKLASAGYVDRLADPADRRVTRVAVTVAGRRLLGDVRARKDAWLGSQLSELTDEDRAALADAAAVLHRLTAPPKAAADP